MDMSIFIGEMKPSLSESNHLKIVANDSYFLRSIILFVDVFVNTVFDFFTASSWDSTTFTCRFTKSALDAL